MTTKSTDRDYVIKAVSGYKSKRHPGMPLTHLPLVVAPAMRELLAEGVLEEVRITKPSNADPSRMMTYAYLRMAKN